MKAKAQSREGRFAYVLTSLVANPKGLISTI